jgi:hypothetical protein
MFKFDLGANINGTSLVGYVDAVPATLVALFGAPQEGDAYKVSGEYAFSDDKGNAFTLYDWKHTSLYGGGPSPAEFWASAATYNFHIGAAGGDWAAFKEWLEKEVTKGS